MAKLDKKINIYVDGNKITDSGHDADILFSDDVQKTDTAKWHSLVAVFFYNMVQVANGKHIDASRYNKVL